MKKILIAAAMAVSAAVYGAEANLSVEGKNPPLECMGSYTPLSINLITPVGIPPGFWNVKGLQIGGWNWVEDFDGWQIGLINTTDVFRGWQLGVINVTRKMYGVQIGVVNVIQDNNVPFLPVINWYF
ncbi:MAG: hypothetical protein ILO34_02520 [Kiritimatiellae bacterium]|nr:hypothetical protein [Kiritimatiellia bacterium]